MTRPIVLLAALFAATTLATSTQAAPISVSSASLNQTFTIVYNGTDDNVNDPGSFTPGLSARAAFTLTTFDALNDYLVFRVGLTNTTQSPITSRISVFAFDVDPNVSSASVSGDYYNKALLNGAMNAHGVGSLDLCFKTGNDSCNQGTGGPTAGQSGTFDIRLNFASLLPESQVTLSHFVIRYQSLNFGSGSGAGIGTCIDCEPDPPCSNGNCDPDVVPEPATLALLGFGLLGAGAARRRTRP